MDRKLIKYTLIVTVVYLVTLILALPRPSGESFQYSMAMLLYLILIFLVLILAAKYFFSETNIRSAMYSLIIVLPYLVISSLAFFFTKWYSPTHNRGVPDYGAMQALELFIWIFLFNLSVIAYSALTKYKPLAKKPYLRAFICVTLLGIIQTMLFYSAFTWWWCDFLNVLLLPIISFYIIGRYVHESVPQNKTSESLTLLFLFALFLFMGAYLVFRSPIMEGWGYFILGIYSFMYITGYLVVGYITSLRVYFKYHKA